MSNTIFFRVFIALSVLLAVFTLLQGCSHVSDNTRQINSNIDVFGVELSSRINHMVLEGVAAEREPCILGYEYLFDSLDVTIGYTHKGVVRSIKTRNENNSIVGIHPGDSLGDAKKQLAKHGFQPGEKADTFRDLQLMITLFPNENEILFGVMAEMHSD